MNRITLNQIENRIARIEALHPECPGEQFVGRYYDELTDDEKELYFDYMYGVNRGFDHTTHESLLHFVYEDEEEYLKRLHSICEKRERDPTIPISNKEWKEHFATVTKEIKKIMREPEERDKRFEEYRVHRSYD